MSHNKYINTQDIVKLTGCSDKEIRKLAQTGVLPAHRTRRNRWRFNVPEVEKYFGIVINKPTEMSNKPTIKEKPRMASQQVNDGISISRQTTRKAPKSRTSKSESTNVLNFLQTIPNSGETQLIINHSHYQEVLQRICTAKSSIKIMTANFKRFNLKPTDNQGDKHYNGTPFIKYLMAKAIQGISVQIICSMPSSYFSDEWKEYYRQMMKPALFDYMFCERNHAKIFIIDDKFAYVGSANVTPAGLGQGIFTPGNIEAGILTENPEIVSSVKSLFSMVWEKKFCTNCHRIKECKTTAK